MTIENSSAFNSNLINLKNPTDGLQSAMDIIVKNDGTHIIDVWLKSHEEVKEFGRKKVKVYLINNK